jgi:hypothetical protein
MIRGTGNMSLSQGRVFCIIEGIMDDLVASGERDLGPQEVSSILKASSGLASTLISTQPKRR